MYRFYCDNCGEEMSGTACAWGYIKAGERGIKVTVVPSWDITKATEGNGERPHICSRCAMKVLVEKYP